MTEEEAFIRGVVAAPGDDALRLVYADWLEERGDSRSGYLRLGAEAGREPLAASAEFDPVWAARVSRPPVGVCCGVLRLEALDGCESAAYLDRVEEEWLNPRAPPGCTARFPPEYRAFLLNYNRVLSAEIPDLISGHGLLGRPVLDQECRVWFFPARLPGEPVPWPLTRIDLFGADWNDGLRCYNYFLDHDEAALQVGYLGTPEWDLLLCVEGKRCGQLFTYHGDQDEPSPLCPSLPELLWSMRHA